MKNSSYAQNARMLAAEIFSAFRNDRLEILTALSHDYQQAIFGLLQADGPWALTADKSISLQCVAEQVIDYRNGDKSSLFDGDNGGQVCAAFIEHLPVTVEHATILLGRGGFPLESLVSRLTKTYAEYPRFSGYEIATLAEDISKKEPEQADRLIADFFEKAQSVESNAAIVDLAIMIRTAMSHDPSPDVKAAIKAKQPLILHRFSRDTKKGLDSLKSMFKMSVDMLTRIKEAGCDALFPVLITVNGVDYSKKGSMSSFFRAGGELPEKFVSYAAGSSAFASDLMFAFAEALHPPGPAKLQAAIQKIEGCQANMLVELWLSSFCDAVARLKEEGVIPSKAEIVNMIELIAVKTDDKKKLRAAALTSSIDGKYLASVPAFRAFRGDFLHQELGL